jgi:O-antigen/teichoic acid export membrane protein
LGIIIRQSVRSTVIAYIGVALGFVITIWLYPNILTAEQYGLTRVLISMAAVSTQFASLGINNTVVRYFPYFNDQAKNHHGLLFFACLVPLAGFVLLGLVLFFGQELIISFYREKSALLIDYYLLLIPMAFFMLFFNVISSVVKVLQNITVASFLNEVVVRVLMISALVGFAVNWISFEQFIALFVLNYGVILAILFIYLFKNYSISFRPDFAFLRKPLLQNIAQYGTFAFLGGVSSMAVANIDVLMLSALAGLEDTGVYAIAFYVGSAITITRKSIYNISSPIIADAFKKKDFALIEDIYKRSSLNQLIGGGLLFCGILVNLNNLISMLPPAYAGGSIVIIIIGAANLFDMSTGLNGAIILNSKRYRFDLYSMLVLMAVTIGLNYVLIPPYGILGAAIGTASAVVLYNALKVLFVGIAFGMQPFDAKMLPVLLIGAAITALSFQVGTIVNVYLDIIIRSGLVTLLYVGTIVQTGISKDFNELVYQLWMSLKKYLPA